MRLRKADTVFSFYTIIENARKIYGHSGALPGAGLGPILFMHVNCLMLLPSCLGPITNCSFFLIKSHMWYNPIRMTWKLGLIHVFPALTLWDRICMPHWTNQPEPPHFEALRDLLKFSKFRSFLKMLQTERFRGAINRVVLYVPFPIHVFRLRWNCCPRRPQCSNQFIQACQERLPINKNCCIKC